MKNERYCECGQHLTQCKCMDEIIQIIYDAAWSRNPPVITGVDKDKLKRFVDGYREAKNNE